MRTVHGLLSITLALLLAVTAVALSGHLTSHESAGSGYCSLCIHAAEASSAITPESTGLPGLTPVLIPDQFSKPGPELPLNLHDHQSRAPPNVT